MFLRIILDLVELDRTGQNRTAVTYHKNNDPRCVLRVFWWAGENLLLQHKHTWCLQKRQKQMSVSVTILKCLRL